MGTDSGTPPPALPICWTQAMHMQDSIFEVGNSHSDAYLGSRTLYDERVKLLSDGHGEEEGQNQWIWSLCSQPHIHIFQQTVLESSVSKASRNKSRAQVCVLQGNMKKAIACLEFLIWKNKPEVNSEVKNEPRSGKKAKVHTCKMALLFWCCQWWLWCRHRHCHSHCLPHHLHHLEEPKTNEQQDNFSQPFLVSLMFTAHCQHSMIALMPDIISTTSTYSEFQRTLFAFTLFKVTVLLLYIIKIPNLFDKDPERYWWDWAHPSSNLKNGPQKEDISQANVKLGPNWGGGGIGQRHVWDTLPSVLTFLTTVFPPESNLACLQWMAQVTGHQLGLPRAFSHPRVHLKNDGCNPWTLLIPLTCCNSSRSSQLTFLVSWGTSCKGCDSECLEKGMDKTDLCYTYCWTAQQLIIC